LHPTARRLALGVGVCAVLWVVWWALHRQFGEVSWASVRSAFAQPATRIAAAMALTALSFLALAMYDLIGARVAVGPRVPARTALFAGATANAISNTLGLHALTGSAVRVRIYRRAGVHGADVARIVSLSWLSLALGFVAMLCVAQWVQAVMGKHPAASLAWGLGLAAPLLLFTGWLATGRREVVVLRFRQPLPSARMVLALMATGAVESAAAIGALYVLLPADLAPSFSLFAIGCIGAVALGLLAHAPGGIGVFEASVTALLSGAGRADLLAALLLYRVVYNLVPFTLAVAALGWHARNVSSTAGSG
jgi:uncharacterized membrane protein YbhN (UPF0104 family)